MPARSRSTKDNKTVVSLDSKDNQTFTVRAIPKFSAQPGKEVFRGDYDAAHKFWQNYENASAKKVTGDIHDWKRALPNDISHIDSMGKDSIAYKRGQDGKLLEVGRYYPQSGYGEIFSTAFQNGRMRAMNAISQKMENAGIPRAEVKKLSVGGKVRFKGNDYKITKVASDGSHVELFSDDAGYSFRVHHTTLG